MNSYKNAKAYIEYTGRSLGWVQRKIDVNKESFEKYVENGVDEGEIEHKIEKLFLLEKGYFSSHDFSIEKLEKERKEKKERNEKKEKDERKENLLVFKKNISKIMEHFKNAKYDATHAEITFDKDELFYMQFKEGEGYILPLSEIEIQVRIMASLLRPIAKSNQGEHLLKELNSYLNTDFKMDDMKKTFEILRSASEYKIRDSIFGLLDEGFDYRLPLVIKEKVSWEVE